MKELAQAHEVPVFQPGKHQHPRKAVALLGDLQSRPPGRGCIRAKFLSRDVAGHPRRTAAINVHASLLPKYRGRRPDRLGPSTTAKARTGRHHQSACRSTLDAGDILAQEAVDILPEGGPRGEIGDSARSARCPAWRLETVDRIAAGPVSGTPTGQVAGEQGAEAQEGGRPDRLVAAWRGGLQPDPRHVRPWPTAYTFLHMAEQGAAAAP